MKNNSPIGGFVLVKKIQCKILNKSLGMEPFLTTNGLWNEKVAEQLEFGCFKKFPSATE